VNRWRRTAIALALAVTPGVISAASMAAPPRHKPPQAAALPIPPIPPANAPRAFLAPTPNLDFIRPTSSARALGPQISPKLFLDRSYDPSQGFLPGSRVDNEPERQHLPTAEFNVSVPLQ
jgi:hypothetical protein